MKRWEGVIRGCGRVEKLFDRGNDCIQGRLASIEGVDVGNREKEIEGKGDHINEEEAVGKGFHRIFFVGEQEK